MGLNEGARVERKRRRFRRDLLKYAGGLTVVAAALLGTALLVQKLAATTKEEFLASGNDYAARNMHREAIIEYRNAVALDPKYGEARLALGRAYRQEGQLVRAMAESLAAADLLPRHVDAQLQATRFLLLARRFEEARARAEAILQFDPGNVDAHIARATALARTSDLQSGIAEIEEAIRLDPGDPRPQMMLGAMLGARQEMPEAEAAFVRAVELAPKSVDAVQALALFYIKAGRSTLAEATLRRAVDLDPALLDSRRRLAAYLVHIGRPAEAEATLVAAAPTTEARLTLADYYISQQRPADARTVLERVAHQDDGFIPARLRLARIEFADGPRGVAAAQRALAAVLNREPKHLDALLLKARFLLATGDAARAVQAAEEAASAAPRSANARSVLADAYAARRDFQAAIRALDETLRLNPTLVSARVRLSNLHLRRREVAAAGRLADEAVQDAPGSVAARFARARAAAAAGRLDDAAADLRLLLERLPSLAAANSQLGDVELRRHNLTAARAAYARALALDPGSLDAVRGQVALDLVEQRPAAALATVERRLATTPDDPAVLMLAASLYQTTGAADRHAAALRRVVEIDPGNLPAFTALLELHVAEQRLDQAFGEYQQLAGGASAAGAQTMMGLILETQNKRVAARVAYEKALAHSPTAAVAANNLAWLMLQGAESLDSALQLALTATRLQPDSPAFNDTLGWIYLEKGLPEAAVPPLEFSVAVAPADPQYRYHLGLAYARAGEPGKAARELTEVLKLKPGYAGAALALRSLTPTTAP